MWGLIAWPGIEHSPLHWECKVVAAGPSEKSPSGPFDFSLHLHPNPCLRHSYNGIMVCNLLWLPAFRIMSVKFTHIVMCIGDLFILLLWGTPLHGYTTVVCPFFCWCTFELFPIWGYYEPSLYGDIHVIQRFKFQKEWELPGGPMVRTQPFGQKNKDSGNGM